MNSSRDKKATVPFGRWVVCKARVQRKWRHGGENKELSGYDELTVTEELRDGERVGNTQGLGVSPWDAEQA